MITDKNLSEAIRDLRDGNAYTDRTGDYWEPDEKDRLVNMFSAGVGISKMALEFKRTEPAVFQQIEKMDLYHRKDYPRRRKKPKKYAACLCPTCKANRFTCPRCSAFDGTGGGF